MTRSDDPTRPEGSEGARPPEGDGHETATDARGEREARRAGGDGRGAPSRIGRDGRDGSDGSDGSDETSLDPTLPEETPRTPAPEREPLPSEIPSDEFGSLLEGPRSRVDELRRVIRIGAEFVRGFRQLQFVGPCVTVFGSSRTPEGHPDYELARALGHELSRAGFTVMTGGGPGIMEAANRGAREAGGRSVGSGIRLVEMEMPNAYLDTFVEFHYFFVRKVMLMKYSYAFVFLPGGFGTLDEVFEAATLIQTRKIRDFPLILMGHEYWQPLLEFIGTLVANGKVDRADAERFMVTDSPEEAARVCREAAIRRFGLSYGQPARRRWWLLE